MSRIALSALIAGAALALAACGDDEERVGSSAKGAKPNAVLLILDELPGDSLLDAGRRIDPIRYPNFAALAGDSVWFRNAYSVYDSTTKAVPLILDGRRPRPGTSPDRRDHPRSLFDMFKREGYRIVASEEASALCPPALCRGGRSKRPAIIPNLMAGRPERFGRWLRSIEAGARPAFWMKHLLLPHGPYLYLPSGTRSRSAPRDLLPGMNSTPGFGDEFLTRHNEQRYLQQLGFADRLLGRLVRRLEDEGIYDETLIVVTADHGYAWESGVETRRSVNPSNVEELTPVPLLVKRPGQRRAVESETYARTLDVPATIADVLGMRLGYRAHGRSAFGAAARRARRVSLSVRDFSSTVSIGGRRWKALRRAVVRRRLRDFGWGDPGSLFTGIGPHRALIGREVGGLAGSSGRVEAQAAIAQARLFGRVRRRSGVVPTQIAGDLGGGPQARRDLAVALNGRIEAVGSSFHLAGDPTEHFAFNVPERSLSEGRNRVEVFEVIAGDRLRLIARN